MSEIAIRVEGLGKRYRLGEREPYRALRDVIAGVPRALLGRRVPSARPNEPFWALRDVSFEIGRGEVVGIIGRNGAGKSTLLKLLSRITRPTVGRARVHGRVGSLLEVGTGFHPELTGRENIFLNGAILGMRRHEIERRFDAIVDFAEVERFLDTPVKHFSSGMYTRLAFAVAAHLEPEILLVDEVLAVGDAAFQKKCLGKMGEVAKDGRTVLFVSHNMAAVENMCQRALLLNASTIACDGTTSQAIGEYLSIGRSESESSLRERFDREGSGTLRFTNAYFQSAERGRTSIICTGEKTSLCLEYKSEGGELLRNVSVSVPFYDYMGNHMFMCWTRVTGQDFYECASSGVFKVDIDKFPLMPGQYSINLWCEVNGVLADWIKEAVLFDVNEGDFFGTGYLSPSGHGGMAVSHQWSIRDSVKLEQ